MNPASLLIPRPAQHEAIRSATVRLADARRSADGSDPDTVTSSLRMTPRGALALLLGVLLPCAALLVLKPQLMAAWHGTMLWWSERLALPLGLVRTGDTAALEWRGSDPVSLMPDPLTTGVVIATVVIGAFAGTFWMNDRQGPMKLLVRTLCAVQASALLFFMFMPERFPHTLSSHLNALLNAGFYLMLALPPLLALGWGVLRLPLQRRLLYPALMLLYFAVMLPHKAVLHALVVQHFSALLMPMLYLCCGAVLDLLVLVALCAWLTGLPPAQALARGTSGAR
jgi:hypothetical protein